MTMDEAINNLSEEEVDLLNSDPQMLADFKAKYSGTPGIMDAVGAAAKSLLPSKETLMAPMKASEHLGKMVEAGGSGIAELDANLLPKAANMMIPGASFKTEPFQPALEQASQNVNAVMNGLEPQTPVGKAGKVVGSFFTPNQIALQATGEAAAKPIIKGLGYGINKIGSLLAPASEEALPGAAKATGNFLSTLSGKGAQFGGAGVSPAELETVMSNPEAVNAAKSFPQVAEDVAGSMNKLTEHLSGLEKTANATLDAKATLPVGTMVDAINAQLKAIKMADVTTPAMENAQEVLEGMLEKVKNRGTMTQPEVAKWVKSVQRKINWKDPLGTDLANALTHVQNTVNDVLKTANPEYATAEGHFADAVNLKNDLSKAMGVSKEPGFTGKFSPENVSVAKLKGLLNPDSAIATKKMLGQFSQVPGVPNYMNIAKQAAAKAALGQGWRSRMAGFLAGMVPGAGRAANTAASGTIQGLPAAGNAVYQGLKD
jgi:hypothetical protein